MAKKKTTSKRDVKAPSAAKLASIVAKHRDALNAEIKKIAPGLILEVAVAPDLSKVHDPAAFFSDWPDTWNDGARWVKTWGKGGDRELLPLDDLRERIIQARIEGRLKKRNT